MKPTLEKLKSEMKSLDLDGGNFTHLPMWFGTPFSKPHIKTVEDFQGKNKNSDLFHPNLY